MVQFDDSTHNEKIEELHKRAEEELAQTLGSKYNVPYIDLSGMTIDTNALRLVPEEHARKIEMAPFDLVGMRIRIAVRSPFKEEVGELVREFENDGYDPEIYIASRASLEKAWKLYSEISYATKSKAGMLDIADEHIEELRKKTHSVEEVATFIKETLSLDRQERTTQIIEVILGGALALTASDIHIEPERESVALRFRIDGVLVPVISFNKEIYNTLRSRLKLLSGMKINIEEEAQDGRFSIMLDKTEMEVRSSSLPGEFGESFVMRLLDPDSLSLDLETLGMRPDLLEIVKTEISKPNGMILNTGPTGSGKTTTLYAFLKRVYEPELKIITIEDPIEYHLPGITQTQVEREKKYTFLSGLTSALRQDPDIIMVGEIRDAETAKTAIQAALTGHLVFSTLHTNTAAGTFPRLLDLGANPDVVGSAINLTMAQRLVRKLDPKTRRERPATDQEKILIESVLQTIPDRSLYEHLWKGVVYEPSTEDGYKGRIGIFEAIVMDAEIEALIRKKASERDIALVASNQKTLTMRQDGMLKVLEGVTDLVELQRVIDLRG